MTVCSTERQKLEKLLFKNDFYEFLSVVIKMFIYACRSFGFGFGGDRSTWKRLIFIFPKRH